MIVVAAVAWIAGTAGAGAVLGLTVRLVVRTDPPACDESPSKATTALLFIAMGCGVIATLAGLAAVTGGS